MDAAGDAAGDGGVGVGVGGVGGVRVQPAVGVFEFTLASRSLLLSGRQDSSAIAEDVNDLGGAGGAGRGPGLVPADDAGFRKEDLVVAVTIVILVVIVVTIVVLVSTN